MATTDSLPDALEILANIDLQKLKEELFRLRELERWARGNLPIDYKEGDRVEIISPKPSVHNSGSGWYIYREALAIGQTGIAGEIKFSPYGTHPGWYVLFQHDHCWSVHERFNAPLKRIWDGPSDEVPEGYTPSYKMDRTKNFMFDISWVRKAKYV
jgi:hypothetical protein